MQQLYKGFRPLIDPGVEMLLFPPRSATTVAAAVLALELLSVIGGVVGAPPPAVPILEEELLLLAASTFEAAHMSNMVEVDGESLKFDVVELLSLVTLRGL